jgi:MerR family transcriptional regulator, light-induced transcriptional regulator
VLLFENGDRLRANANRIAQATTDREYARLPFLRERYGEKGKIKCFEDVLYNVGILAGAVDVQDGKIFLGYAAFLKVLLTTRGVAAEDVAESLRCLANVLTEELPGDNSLAASYALAAAERFGSMPDTASSFIATPSEDHRIARSCLEALLRLDAGSARAILEVAITGGMPLARIYDQILPSLMREVGRLWQINEITVAHEHYCSAAVQTILTSFYRPAFSASPQASRKVIVACVEGERHELGARTVADFFELNGWRTTFLGANLPGRDLAALIRPGHQVPDLIALSATMPWTLAPLAAAIEAIRDKSNVPIIVGGYVLQGRPDLASELGADGCADDAESALALAHELVEQPDEIP